MEKTRKEQLKEDIASGSASFAGATAGVVMGTFAMSEEAAAQELPVHNTMAANTVPGGLTVPTHNEQPQIQSTATPTPQPQTQAQPTPHTEPEQNIEVLGYQTVTGAGGSQADVAVANVNGAATIYIDVDHDGTADIQVSDINHNGQLEGNEIIDLTVGNMPMPHLEDTTDIPLTPPEDHDQDDDLITNNNGPLPDYVNNANVGEYMA